MRFFLTIFCLLYLNAKAQQTAWSADPAKENWLPNQAIRTIYQDFKGNIWVGTNGGVYKYNLFNVVNYNLTKKATNGFLNNAVRCINGTPDGTIFIGTESGLGVMDPVTGAVAVVTKDDETVREIAVSKKGAVWYVTNSGKLYALHKKSSKHYEPELLYGAAQRIKGIQAMAVLENENVLIGTASGLLLFSKASKILTRLSFAYAVTALHTDENGLVWTGTADHGLYRIRLNPAATAIQTADKQTASENEDINDAAVTAIASGPDNTILFSTPSELFVVNHQIAQSINKNRLFKESFIAVLMVDKTNNIWIGSTQGVFKIRPQYLELQYVNLLPDKYVPDNNLSEILAMSKNELWLINTRSGIRKYNTLTKLQQQMLLPFSVYSIARKAANGDLLLIADDELILIRSQNQHAASPAYEVIAKGKEWADVNDMEEVEPGEWWATSWSKGLLYAAINKLKQPDAKFVLLSKQFRVKSHLFSILKDSRNNVWIGSRGDGLVKLNLETGRISRYNKKSKASDRIMQVAEDQKGNLWVATRGDGLLLYQRGSDNFLFYEEKDGLPSNTICAIQENSKGELWVSTLNGVATMLDGQLIPFQSFGPNDGIVNSEFNFHVSAADGNAAIYFGNGSGFYKVKKRYRTNRTVMPVSFTSFELLRNGKPETIEEAAKGNTARVDYYQQLLDNKKLVLPHSANSFSIGFAALDYTVPEKNRFVYRLTGRDTAWTMLQGVRQQVQFINLPPGNYLFEVKAANPLGEWSPETQSLQIVIKPSFWTTGFAILLYIMLLLLALLIVFRIRKRWYRLNRRLEEEIESSKIHNKQMVFYTDLSHEIKNRLSLLLGPLEQALHGKKVNPQVLNNLYEQGLRLKKLTDQIMDIRKSESGGFLLNVAEEDITAIIQQIVNEAAPLAVIKNVHISFSRLKNDIIGWCDEEMLEIIVMNLVSNAIKYCKNNGTVHIKADSQYLGETDLPQGISREGNYLCITVVDTGVGIAKDEIDKIIEPFYRAENVRYNKKNTPGTGIGLNLVARLISRHHGSLEIRSELNEFTSVTVYLPVDKQAYALSEIKPHVELAPIIIPAETTVDEHASQVIRPDEKSAPGMQEPPTKEWHVLIADDDPEILQLLTDSLCDEFTVYRAANGVEALALLEQQEINLVISDLDMPSMDGLTLCRNIRLHHEYKQIPFLLLTGRNSEEQKVVAFQNQVDDFIEKPFSPELLKWKVKSFLRSSAAKVRLKTVMVVEPNDEIRESAEDKFIQDIVNLIETNLDKDYLDVDFLAENMFSSRATFYRRMEQLVGESPSVFIRKYRLKKAALYLKTGNYSVAEVTKKIGFSNSKYFSKCFQKEFGVSPADFMESASDIKKEE